MYAQKEKSKNYGGLIDRSIAQKKGHDGHDFAFQDNRPERITRRQLQKTSKSSRHVKQLSVHQEIADRRPSRGLPVQLKIIRGMVERSSDAVEMNKEGSIYAGKIYKKLQLGEFAIIDDADKWRSLRDVGPQALNGTRWFRILCIGTTDLSDRKIYVKDNAVAETTDQVTLLWEETALQINKILGPAVEMEVDGICNQLGVERAKGPDLGSVEKIIRYFTWLAAIGENLGRIFGDLNAFVSEEIKKYASSPSDEELNENSDAGRALDRALIEEINKRLKVLTGVLASDISEVVESLIDALGGNTNLKGAISSVLKGERNLTKTLGEYLMLGKKGMEKAMGHQDASWNKALTSALESASGCYAAQAQAIERTQPREEVSSTMAFDPKFENWTISKKDLSYMDPKKDGQDLDDDGIADLKVGDRIKSGMVNPGYFYQVVQIDGNNIALKAIRT
jgi:hypothetical protein